MRRAIERYPALAPLLAALLVRLVWIVLVPNEPVSDQVNYHDGAKGIADGVGFIFADGHANGFWPVGYSGALSLPYALFGASYHVAYAFNLFLGLALVALVDVLGRQLHGPRTGLLAAWFAALYPTFVMYTTVIASENLYLPLLVVVLVLAIESFRPTTTHGEGARGWLLMVLAGLVLGGAILVRPTALAFPAVVLLAGLLLRAGWGASIGKTAVVAVLAVGVCVPWGVRNEHEFGEFTLSAFNGGPVLWMGNHAGPPTTQIPERFHDMNVVERHHAMKDEAMAHIKAEPGAFLVRCATRTVTALKSETIGVVWNEIGVERRFGASGATALKLLGSLAWWVLVIATLAAFAWAAKRWELPREDLLLLVAMAVNAVPFVLFDSQNRYHLPIVPFAMVVAAGVVVAWRARRVADAAAGSRGPVAAT